MRTGLIILGVIFLVLGGILYFYPSQSFSAQTNVAPSGQNNVVNSSARFQIPVEWSYALSIIGALFLIFGLVIPNPMPLVVPTVAPAPVAQTHTIITGTPGPRGPRGSKGTKGLKGSKGKTQSAKTVSKRRASSPGASVTTTTTRTN